MEDYTGKGTSDLRLGLVRTPLPPAETLLDDPLRVLRAVRFASRLGFKVHPELIDAGSDPRVHEALRHKVNSEAFDADIRPLLAEGCELTRGCDIATTVMVYMVEARFFFACHMGCLRFLVRNMT